MPNSQNLPLICNYQLLLLSTNICTYNVSIMMKNFFLLALLLISSSVNARPGLLDSLGLGDNFDSPPSVEEAFQFELEVNDQNSLIARWFVAEGNYLYRDKLHFELTEGSHNQLGSVTLPAGQNKMDEIFGLTEVYPHDGSVIVPLIRSGPENNISITLKFQGCSETFHICYPPTEQRYELVLPPLSNESTASAQQALNPPAPTPLSQHDQIAQSLEQDSLLTILVSFLGLGLLLAFTPCVFPMIPILSSIIVGQGDRITTRRAFMLSFSYVLAMSVTYTAAGVLTGLLGENLQALFQNPWIIASFSTLFIVLALSMFDLFELQLPHFLQHRIHQVSHQQQGGSLVGAATMGLLSGLIVGPCLAPPLAGALIFIGQHGDPILGGMALFSLSMGMGLPLLIIGTSAGKLLPQAGTWMNTIKVIFGVLMIALAIWMLERIIPEWIALLLWGSFAIIVAIYLGALTHLYQEATGWQKLRKGGGIIMLIFGGLLLIGGTSGSSNVWQPLKAISTQSPQASIQPQHVNFTRVNNLAELHERLNNSTQPTVLDFYADWCVECKRMEATTFQDPAVIADLAAFQTLQVDLTNITDDHNALLKQFGLFGPPTLLFFNRDGQEQSAKRLIGMIEADALRQHLTQL
jgi:thiol:disulfide interchange protein DsbD